MERGTPLGRKPVRPDTIGIGCFAIETPLTTPFNLLFAVSRIDFDGFHTVHSLLPKLIYTISIY